MEYTKIATNINQHIAQKRIFTKNIQEPPHKKREANNESLKIGKFRISVVYFNGLKSWSPLRETQSRTEVPAF